ncbi:hypothetical protein CAEBREN_02178 [Caenorhabditis brenneri]|uniref:Uncharacterized protein n=1 Tax=Caenorhabditis brenneri TaxID=135651 RepID=G0NI09_CAEBE|nr:hypothetical protein CAEBREN_02178 [Caenorhabditis brenneri]
MKVQKELKIIKNGIGHQTDNQEKKVAKTVDLTRLLHSYLRPKSLETAILLSLPTVTVVASTNDGEEFGMSDLIKKYPQLGDALNRILARAKLLNPAPVMKSNETTFVEWICHLKERKDYMEKPKNASLDIIRTSFLTVLKDGYGFAVSGQAKDCRSRAFAFAYVGCNRPCDSFVDLFINSCSAEKTEQFPAWAMA